MNVFVFMQLCSYAVSACFPCFLVEGVGRRGGEGGGGGVVCLGMFQRVFFLLSVSFLFRCWFLFVCLFV